MQDFANQALVDHYGPKEFAMVHFDAHLDMEDNTKKFGVFTHGAQDGIH